MEYGWTPQVIFDQLTRKQVEKYLGAISLRYKRQSDAIEKANKSGYKPNSRPGEDEVIDIDAMFANGKPQDLRQLAGVNFVIE